MTKGNRIKYLRDKSGFSQVDLADRIGVSKQTLYKYENDIITNIPSDKIELIAAYTNSTPAYIMGWNESESYGPLVGASGRILSTDEASLLDNYQKLNATGKKKAREDVRDLTEIPRYTEEESSSGSMVS